ncbi:MAG: cysteine desulfurase [Chloroflexi bacterium]|nr:cysteine desulfurase [Chloroflexota bacterium]
MIYLDFAATTPVDARVLNAMLPYFNADYGNPSSIHRHGQKAEAAVDKAREKVAAILHCQPEEILFTSGGTESDNLALRGFAFSKTSSNGVRRILTAKTEHHAISRTAEYLEREHGIPIVWLEVDPYGAVVPQALERGMNESGGLVSLMLANNEIGTINPVEKLSQIARTHGAVVHSDVVQAAAYLDVNVETLGVDMISLGGHKFYGPKGIGALYVRKGMNLVPQISGGGQEFGMRSGTHNVPYIVGFAEALHLASSEREFRCTHVKPLRDRIMGTVLEQVVDSALTGHPDRRMPNHASFVFKDVDGNALLQLLDAAGFACSSGSACKTGNPEPSDVISALGISKDWALGSLRITLGVSTTESDVDRFLHALPGLVEKARGLKRKNHGDPGVN